MPSRLILALLGVAASVYAAPAPSKTTISPSWFPVTNNTASTVVSPFEHGHSTEWAVSTTTAPPRHTTTRNQPVPDGSRLSHWSSISSFTETTFAGITQPPCPTGTPPLNEAFFQAQLLHGIEGLASLLMDNATASNGGPHLKNTTKPQSTPSSVNLEPLCEALQSTSPDCPLTSDFDVLFLNMTAPSVILLNRRSAQLVIVQVPGAPVTGQAKEQMPHWLTKLFYGSRIYYYVAGIVCDCVAGLWYSGLAAKNGVRITKAIIKFAKSWYGRAVKAPGRN